MDFADFILLTRRMYQLTQKQFAQHLGLCQMTISLLENRRRKPGPKVLRSLSKFTGLETWNIRRDYIDNH